MDDLLTDSIDRITDQLRADPYRPDLLVERIILCVAGGDAPATRGDLHFLRRMGCARTLVPTLEKIATGTGRIIVDDGAYLIFERKDGFLAVESFLPLFRSMRSEAHHFFGTPSCRFVIDASSEPGSVTHSSHEVPGIGYIRIVPRETREKSEQLLAHELAHIHLHSGNRFLDEGVAVMFQSRLARQGSVVVGPGIDVATSALPEAEDTLPLRAMLAYDARHDVYFDQLAPALPSKQLIYSAACATARHLFETIHRDGVETLFTMLRTTSDTAAHPAVVADYIDEDIESLDEQLFGRSHTAETAASSYFDNPSIPAATIVWATLSPGELEDLIDQLRAPPAFNRPRIASRALLCRALTRRLLEDESQTPAADLAEARSLVCDLGLTPHLPSRDHLLLKGWLAIAEIHVASNAASQMVNWEKALSLFTTAQAKYPNDPEILCATAALHLRGPEAYGADHALARRYLNKAAQIEGWKELAQEVARGLR